MFIKDDMDPVCKNTKKQTSKYNNNHACTLIYCGFNVDKTFSEMFCCFIELVLAFSSISW